MQKELCTSHPFINSLLSQVDSSSVQKVYDARLGNCSGVHRRCERIGTAQHSPPRRGGVDATLIRCCKASFVGADGVVSFGEMFRPKVSPIWPPRLRGIGGFASSLTAHPPLLCEEGNVARFNSFSCS